MKTCECERKGSRTRVLAEFNKQEQRKSTKKKKGFRSIQTVEMFENAPTARAELLEAESNDFAALEADL